MSSRSTSAVRVALACAVALILLVPTLVSAHAELDTATPPDGSTVEGSPPEVSGTYTQDMKADGSSIQLRDAADEVVAEGGVDPSDDRRMVIEDLPGLVPGAYEVRWTTVSAEDDEVARGTWSFTVTAAPTPTATIAPTPSATLEPSATPTLEPSPTPTASPTAAPSPAPGDPASTGMDVLLPILVGLVIVAIAAFFLLRRRGPVEPTS
jgi:methionine-rich copper-binding protein CopC